MLPFGYSSNVYTGFKYFVNPSLDAKLDLLHEIPTVKPKPIVASIVRLFSFHHADIVYKQDPRTRSWLAIASFCFYTTFRRFENSRNAEASHGVLCDNDLNNLSRA